MSMLRKYLAVDLGTANTLVYVPDQGLVLNTPSMVAIDSRTRRILALGADAKAFLGKTPRGIEVIKPMKDGVIADFNMAGELLKHVLHLAIGKTLTKPDVLICVPLNISNVEQRAVVEAALSAGAHSVRLIAEPVAGAIGGGIPVHAPEGHMVVDIGGGTTDIAVCSLGTLVESRCLRLAGDTLTLAIQQYIQNNFGLAIGENMAERVKITVGTLTPQAEKLSMNISGKHILRGKPHTISISDGDLRQLLTEALQPVLDTAVSVLENTPPELSGDLLGNGILLTGGCSLLRGLPELLHETTKLPVRLDEDPLTTVLRGAARVVEAPHEYQDMLLPA